jgi:hypothetical protein
MGRRNRAAPRSKWRSVTVPLSPLQKAHADHGAAHHQLFVPLGGGGGDEFYLHPEGVEIAGCGDRRPLHHGLLVVLVVDVVVESDRVRALLNRRRLVVGRIGDGATDAGVAAIVLTVEKAGQIWLYALYCWRPVDWRAISTRLCQRRSILLGQAMGTWGVEIFEDDVACDVRGAVHELLAKGNSMRAITDDVLERFSTSLLDEDDGPVVVFALAAAQWEIGDLDPRVKKKALDLIDAGVDLRWREQPEYYLKREEVLKALAAKLLNFSLIGR